MWLLPTVICCGVLTWASFLYVGIKAKRPSWLAAAAFYGVVFVLYFVLADTAPEAADGTTTTSSWQSTAASIFMLAVWIGGAVHALVINREWLALQATPQDPATTSWFSASSAINPWTLDDPWRSFVSQALTMQRDITTAAIRTPPGPMRDRLQAVAGRVDTSMTEVWQVAQGGQRLVEARARIDTAAIAQRLNQLPTAGPFRADPSLAEAARALQAQLDTATRIEREVSSTYNGLVLLNARFGEVAARVIELSARPHALADVAALDTAVASVVLELTAIRQALTEMDRYPTGR
ncbi:MAG: hypothetical protein MUF83_01585 [Acidimicrobiales bacterium]|jgi:hypothetical protein|nr:hypothetical protein [Acidimicrobiales bacterium]